MLIRGESVKIKVDYDLFGTNINESIAIFIKKDGKTNKCLLYLEEVGEWAEIEEEGFTPISPGVVPAENLEFVSRIKTLNYTYGSPQ